MTEPAPSHTRLATVMVSVDLGIGTQARVAAAAALAARFSSLLVGVAACPPMAESDGQHMFERDEDPSIQCLEDAERVFRKSAMGPSDWRCGVDEPDAFLVDQARCADLVVVGRRGESDPSGGRMGVCPGTIAVLAGRPVLVVPARERRDSMRRVLVAWKDTPESRRALADSLPFLKDADEVVVLTVGEKAANAGLRDVCGHLERHGVSAVPVHEACGRGSVGQRIVEQAEARAMDLIVSGAYGHSRIREWAFGGVTRELLRYTPCPCLLSR